MRAIAAAPRPPKCGHEDEHPTAEYAELRSGLPHFYAPEEFPPVGEQRSAEAWTCSRFAGAVAEECIRGLDEYEGEDEDDS
ncbi:hypothetical protein ACFU98_09090 [Streptomyces sp. NPDC057575]|uniref:hypothetical protein n=1 Tax=unclassified Streptomyces TaxID=2593676 RepID=UPI0036B32455